MSVHVLFILQGFQTAQGLLVGLLTYTERNFQTATQYFLIYLNIYDTYMAATYTQYGTIN